MDQDRLGPTPRHETRFNVVIEYRLPRYRIGFGERMAVLTLSNADLMMEGKGHRRRREEMSIAQKREAV